MINIAKYYAKIVKPLTIIGIDGVTMVVSLLLLYIGTVFRPDAIGTPETGHGGGGGRTPLYFPG